MGYPTHHTIVREILNEKLRVLLNKIRLGDVLEIGAGKLNYKSMIRHKSYVTLDVNRKHTPDVVSDIHKCGIMSSSFDIVLMIEVLEHCHNPQKAINEVHRILKSGGACVISTRFMQPLHEQPHDYYRYTKHSLQLLFKNFKNVKIYPMGNWVANIFNILYWRKSKLFKLFTPIVLRMYGTNGGVCPLGYVVQAEKPN